MVIYGASNGGYTSRLRPLLGTEALEALGLKLSPQTGELEPTRGYTLRA